VICPPGTMASIKAAIQANQIAQSDKPSLMFARCPLRPNSDPILQLSEIS
jgi:hypothetical protein